MGMLDRPSSNRFWKFSFYAKEEGLFSAELQVASSRKLEQKSIVSSITSRRRSYQEEGGMCDVSLRIRAHLFYLRARVAAGRLREMRLQTWKGPAKKLTLLDFRNSLKSSPSSPNGFHIFKRSVSSSTSKGSSSWFLRSLFTRKKRKGSLFICGAGVGAFAMFLFQHASACTFHLPSLALNAGSRLVCFLAKFALKKCDKTGSKRAACLLQGIRRAFSLFQMFMSLLRSMFIGNPFVMTSLLAVLIGVILVVRQFERHSRQASK